MAGLIAAAAPPALANGGTLLVFAGFFRLLFGNFLLGLGEGLLLAWVFKVRRKRAIGLMIAANYASMFAGWLGLSRVTEGIRQWIGGEAFFYHLSAVIVALWVASFVMTVAVEWPFCMAVLGRRPRWLGKGFRASLVAQAASYAVLIPLGYLASSVTLITVARPDRTLVPNAPDIATIYFLGIDDGDLYRIRLNGQRREKLLPVGGTDRRTVLFLHRAAGAETWDLCLESHRPKAEGPIVLIESITRGGALSWGRMREPDKMSGTSYWRDRRAATQSDEPGPVLVKSGYEAPDSLIVTDARTQQSYAIGLEVPGIRWGGENPSLLPGGLVIYQLGDQVVLFDLATKRIGRITAGRQPVVVLDEPSGTTAPGWPSAAADR